MVSSHALIHFPLGQTVMTRGVADLAAENEVFAKFVSQSLKRHAQGDWGDLSAEDKEDNNLSLKQELRLLSSYETQGLPKIWIITESNRLVTSILFPEDY